MTTTVQVLITGNKNVIATVHEADGAIANEKEIAPNCHASFLIHGEQILAVKETGEFVN